MELCHCDVCGSLVSATERNGQAPAPGAVDVGLLCETCLKTRRVLPDAAGPEPAGEERKPYSNRFRCPHCDRRLRTKIVRARVEIDCPKCGGGLILLPGGGLEPGKPPWPIGPARGSVAEAVLGPPPSDLADAIASDAFEALAASDFAPPPGTRPLPRPEAAPAPAPPSSPPPRSEPRPAPEPQPAPEPEPAPEPRPAPAPEPAEAPRESGRRPSGSGRSAAGAHAGSGRARGRSSATSGASRAIGAARAPPAAAAAAVPPERPAAGQPPRALLLLALLLVGGGLGGAYAARTWADAPAELRTFGERIGRGFAVLETRLGAWRAR